MGSGESIEPSGWRILRVFPNSPSSSAGSVCLVLFTVSSHSFRFSPFLLFSIGFITYFDFILGANGVRLDGNQASFARVVASSVGKPLKFTIYNCKTAKYRGTFFALVFTYVAKLTPCPFPSFVSVCSSFCSFRFSSLWFLHSLSRSLPQTDITIVPRQWATEKEGLLGLIVRYCSFATADEMCLHVLEVFPGSPAFEAGLEPFV